MTSQTQDLKLNLQSLSSTFTELEHSLAPLFVQSLPEFLVDLEPIQSAKLQTLIAQVVYDLILIYLKTKGIDPKSHPVLSELERIKAYYAKIHNAENPLKRTIELDKNAASRFIKHAIAGAQSQWKMTRAEEDQDQDSSKPDDTNKSQPSSSSSPKRQIVPPKLTTKMLARQRYEEELREPHNDGSEVDDLEVYDQTTDLDDSPSVLKTKGKRKSPVPSNTPTVTAPSKRRRTAMDPFAASGIVDDDDETGESPTPASSFIQKSIKTSSGMPTSDVTVLPSHPAPDDKTKKKKKKKKKN